MNYLGCKLPPELTEDQIDDILDGDISPEVRHHLSVCSYCAQRVERARAIESHIRSTLHPSPEDLIAYAEHELPATDSEKITLHLKHCEQCQKEVEAWKVFNGSANLDLPQRAFSPRRSKTAGPWSNFSPTVDMTRVDYRDSNNEPAIGFELRNEQHNVLISLRWYPSTSRITGFLIPEENSAGPSWEDGVVVGIQNNTIAETTVISPIGSFQLEKVVAGTLTLSITGPDARQLRIEDLVLPPS